MDFSAFLDIIEIYELIIQIDLEILEEQKTNFDSFGDGQGNILKKSIRDNGTQLSEYFYNRCIIHV